MRDLMNSTNPKVALAPLAAAVANDTPQVSQIINVQGYDSLTFLIVTGVLADAGATFTVLIEDSDDPGMGGATPVPDDELIGTEALASFTEAADGVCRKIGYRGGKQYVRMTITPVGNVAAAPMAVIAVLGHSSFVATAPTPN